jgi:peptidyl-tRNA hydrolase, PTH1 family
MRLVVGLGNPGLRFAKNRHNVGFVAVDAIARRHGFPAFRDRFKGELSEAAIGGDKRLLLKPQTFMNASGEAVLAAASFYKIPPSEIVVIHDEIDLRPGKLRVKKGGGSAGHNGLRSIDAMLGSDYWRVRIGVGHPGVKELVHPHVLSDFAKDEKPWVEALCGIIADNAELLVKGQDASFQNKVHLAMQAKGFGEPKEPDQSV